MALTAPALGTGWRDFYVKTHYENMSGQAYFSPPTKAELVDHHFDCFRRRMKDKGLTEITGYSYEITRRADGYRNFTWVVEAQAKLR